MKNNLSDRTVAHIQKIAARLISAEHNPAADAARRQLAQKLLDWHGGMATGLYSVGSSWIAGYDAPPESIMRADEELQRLIDKDVPHPESMSDEDVQEIIGLKAELGRLGGINSV